MIAFRLLLTAGALTWLTFGRLPDISLCMFLWLTGLPCPLCGMTRALTALLHGDWMHGVSLHALSPGVLLLFLVLVISDCFRLVGRDIRMPRSVVSRLPATGLTILAIYGISRWPLH